MWLSCVRAVNCGGKSFAYIQWTFVHISGRIDPIPVWQHFRFVGLWLRACAGDSWHYYKDLAISIGSFQTTTTKYGSLLSEGVSLCHEWTQCIHTFVMYVYMYGRVSIGLHTVRNGTVHFQLLTTSKGLDQLHCKRPTGFSVKTRLVFLVETFPIWSFGLELFPFGLLRF